MRKKKTIDLFGDSGDIEGKGRDLLRTGLKEICRNRPAGIHSKDFITKIPP